MDLLTQVSTILRGIKDSTGQNLSKKKINSDLEVEVEDNVIHVLDIMREALDQSFQSNDNVHESIDFILHGT